MKEAQVSRREPPPPRGFLADRPIKVNRFTAWLYRTLWDLRHPSTRFLFVATTGRSGTATFARLFDACPGVRGWHEPRPKMNGEVLIARQAGRDSVAAREYWTRKSVNIRRGATGASWYAEANHLFIKSFHDYVQEDLGDRVSVLHIRRDPVRVASSMARLPETPGTEAGAKWYPDWRLEENELHVPDLLSDGAEFGTPFFRCLWYWYETEARIRRFREESPSIPVHQFDWAGRIDPGPVGDLLREIGLPHDPARVAEICGARTNTKDGEKEAWAADASAEAERALPELRAEHVTFRSHLREKYPDLPGFAEGGGAT